MIKAQVNGECFFFCINFTSCNADSTPIIDKWRLWRHASIIAYYLKYFRRLTVKISSPALYDHYQRICRPLCSVIWTNMDETGNNTNNFSAQRETVDTNPGTSKGWQAFQIIFWTWLSAAAVIGNGLVLVCVLLKKRRNSSTFKFYGSLALGDLLVG